MPTHRRINPKVTSGFTLVELMVSLAISALILGALAGLTSQGLQTASLIRQNNELAADVRFAMQRMVTAVLGTRRLLLPLADNPNTNWREHVREQTVPPSAPEGDSILATAVLAVTLDPNVDTDADGFADGDNDKDGRVDEDIGDDHNQDFAAGIFGIDDDGDGLVDESNNTDDDEDEDQTGNRDEDRFNGIDDDGDGAVDEDFGADMNEDGGAGVLGVDDDGDGAIDESIKDDDDEDQDDSGTVDEDWFDPIVFFLSGTTLLERRPNLNPADGTDYGEQPIAENITRFRVERFPQGSGRAVLVDITLDTTGSNGKTISLNTRVRVGGGQ